MEQTKIELKERIENLLEEFDTRVSLVLKPSWDDYSSELAEIIEDLVDETAYDSGIEEKLNDLANDLENAETLEELEEIEEQLNDVERDIYDLEIDSDVVLERIDEAFIYYSDAWEYLQNIGQTEFEEAFESGYTDVCSIAAFYMAKEYGLY